MEPAHDKSSERNVFLLILLRGRAESEKVPCPPELVRGFFQPVLHLFRFSSLLLPSHGHKHLNPVPQMLKLNTDNPPSGAPTAFSSSKHLEISFSFLKGQLCVFFKYDIFFPAFLVV